MDLDARFECDITPLRSTFITYNQGRAQPRGSRRTAARAATRSQVAVFVFYRTLKNLISTFPCYQHCQKLRKTLRFDCG